MRNFGVEFASSMIKTLSESGVKGFHICTLNLEQSIKRIVHELSWKPKVIEKNENEELLDMPTNSLIAVSFVLQKKNLNK